MFAQKLHDSNSKDPSWHAKIWRGLRHIAGGLLLPGITVGRPRNPVTGKRKFKIGFSGLRAGIYAAVYFVIQPLSVLLFPRAEDVFEKEGLDPRIVSNVAPGEDIRIVPDNIWGKAYALFPSSPLMHPVNFYSQVQRLGNNSVLGFNMGESGYVTKIFCGGVSGVLIKQDALQYKRSIQEKNRQTIERSSDGRYTLNALQKEKDMLHTVLIHEMRHSCDENRNLSPLLREADAFYYAATELSRQQGNDSAKTDLLNMVALYNDADMDHNVALYLYKKFNNEAVPGEDEIRAANREAGPMIEMMAEFKLKNISGDKLMAFLLKEKFNQECAKLSPLARLRVVLSEQAWDRAFVKVGARPGV